MHGLKVEHRHLNGKPLARDLAMHVCGRSLHSKAVIVTNKPLSTLASVKKQWVQMMRKLQTERARTLDHRRRIELISQLDHMQSLSFTAKAPEDILEADVTFATADNLVKVAPECYTMYVTYAFPRVKLHMITSWMPRNGMVVIYGQG